MCQRILLSRIVAGLHFNFRYDPTTFRDQIVAGLNFNFRYDPTTFRDQIVAVLHFNFRYDPTTFRDQIVAGLNEAEEDLELASKFLIQSGSKLDFRRYAEALFDVLITGK